MTLYTTIQDNFELTCAIEEKVNKKAVTHTKEINGGVKRELVWSLQLQN